MFSDRYIFILTILSNEKYVVLFGELNNKCEIINSYIMDSLQNIPVEDEMFFFVFVSFFLGGGWVFFFILFCFVAFVLFCLFGFLLGGGGIVCFFRGTLFVC
jgi:hypothetical protein